jgi:stage II sporulation protein GA (sporulation sigma-E factor processing peptidase)
VLAPFVLGRRKHVVIYLDVIWLLNFGIDMLLLILTGLVLKLKLNKWRVCIGALFGSCIVFLYFSPLATFVIHPVTKLVYSGLIVFITFGYKRFRFFFKTLCTLYFVSFVTGGGLLGLHFFFQSEVEWMNGVMSTYSGGMGDPISWLFLLIGFPLLWYFSKKQMDDIEVKKIKYDQIVKVEIKVDDVLLQLKGLIDSGNQLYDPITNTPVMIADAARCQDSFPKDFMEQIKSVDNLYDSACEHQYSHRLRIVPYRGIGQESEFLLALKPDEIKIEMKEETIVTKNGLIGFNQTPLSADGEYDCIVHPKIISSGKQPVTRKIS